MKPHVITSVACLTAGLGLLNACGQGPVEKGNLKDSVWSTDCGLNGKVKYEVRFTDKQMTYAEIRFDHGVSATNCTTEDYRITWTYDYTVGDELGVLVNGLLNVRKVDFTLKSISALPTTDTGAAVLIGNCSGPSYSTGTSIDLLADAAATADCTYTYQARIAGNNYDTSTGETSKFASGAKIYQIMGIESLHDDQQNLYFGQFDNLSIETDALAETRRPSSVEQDRPYKFRSQ